MIEPRHDINQSVSAYDKALRQTLVAHGLVALAGIIPAAATLIFSHDQFIHAAGLVVSGGIETGNLLQLRTTLRRSRVQL